MLLMFNEKPLTVISLPIFASLDVPVPSQQAANTTESPPVDISALLRSFGVSALNSFLQALIFARVVYYSLYTPIVDALSCFLRLVTTDASDLSTEGLLCPWECLSTSCPYQRSARSSWTSHLTCRIVLKLDHGLNLICISGISGKLKAESSTYKSIFSSYHHSISILDNFGRMTDLDLKLR